jgi:hypothetical protein
MPEDLKYDVFLSHSAKDKAVVRAVAERLRKDGLKVWFDEWVLKPGDSIPAKIEEGLERSRVLVLCMSANAFGSDWAQLEAGTFRFRDPLNQERRFIPLRLDDTPIKGLLSQFLYINWRPADREQEYAKLLEACRPGADATALAAVGLGSGNRAGFLSGLIAQKDRIPPRKETLQIDALELCERLRTVPPLGETEFKKDYRGFWVCWRTIFAWASKDSSETDLCRLRLHPDVPEGYTTPIECSVSLAEYPTLKILQRGARLRVKGQIEDFTLFSVRLANATIEFPESQAAAKAPTDACSPEASDAVPSQPRSRPIGEVWSGLRGVLQQAYSTQVIKGILGKAGLPISEIEYTGTYKGPVLDEADRLVSAMDDQARDRFAVGCVREVVAFERARAANLSRLGAEPDSLALRDLRQVLARFGCRLSDLAPE